MDRWRGDCDRRDDGSDGMVVCHGPGDAFSPVRSILSMLSLISVVSAVVPLNRLTYCTEMYRHVLNFTNTIISHYRDTIIHYTILIILNQMHSL